MLVYITSYKTQPTFFYHGTWDDTTRKHPAMNWMEDYTKNFIDAKKFDTPPTDWHSSEFTLQTHDGTIIKGADDAVKVLEEMYSPFSSHHYEPEFFCCTETENGWEMIGTANLFMNFVGPASDRPKVQDPSGNEWDLKSPGAFMFEYVKGGKTNGIELKSTKIFSDTLPAVSVLLERGLLKPEDLTNK